MSFEEIPLPLKADSFKLCECGDLNCGLHIVGIWRGTPVCEIVVEPEHIPDIIGKLKDALYRIEAMKD